MCSSPEQRIAAFGRAIEELASQSRSAPGGRGTTVAPGDQGGQDAPAAAANPGAKPAPAAPNQAAIEKVPGDTGGPENHDAVASSDILSRLAALWAELATLDPEVAKRLPTYEA